MTAHDWQDFKIARVALVKLGTVRMRELCDAVEQGAAATAAAERAGTTMMRATPVTPGVSRRARAESRTEQIRAYIAEAPRTFAEIKAQFPQLSSNQLSQTLNHMKVRGLVSKRGRRHGTPWRARRAS